VAWQFKQYQTHGTGQLIATLEKHGFGDEKSGQEGVELSDVDAKVSFLLYMDRSTGD
jgi:hypothetical protein